MSNIAVASLFRDSMVWCGHQTNQVIRYFNQLNSQTLDASDRLRFYCLEGNSKDNTYDVLQDYSNKDERIILLKDEVPNAFPMKSSAETARFSHLGLLYRQLFDKILSDNWSDWILLIESDLIVGNNLIEVLLDDHIYLGDYCAAISPIIMLEKHTLFYDTWGFIDTNGKGWSNYFPYSEDIVKPDRFIPMNCIGSCLLINTSIIKYNKINFDGDGEGHRSFCKKIRDAGHILCVDKMTTVWHPGNACIESRWI